MEGLVVERWRVDQGLDKMKEREIGERERREQEQRDGAGMW